MNQRELLELKGWGHQLLNAVAEKRKIHKDDVYRLLSNELKIKKEHAHFGTMDYAQTQQAVNGLLRILKKNPIPKKKKVRVKPPVVIRPKKTVAEKEAEKQLLHEIKMANKRADQKKIHEAIANLPKWKPSPWKRFVLWIMH